MERLPNFVELLNRAWSDRLFHSSSGSITSISAAATILETTETTPTTSTSVAAAATAASISSSSLSYHELYIFIYIYIYNHRVNENSSNNDHHYFHSNTVIQHSSALFAYFGIVATFWKSTIFVSESVCSLALSPSRKESFLCSTDRSQST